MKQNKAECHVNVSCQQHPAKPICMYPLAQKLGCQYENKDQPVPATLTVLQPFPSLLKSLENGWHYS